MWAQKYIRFRRLSAKKKDAFSLCSNVLLFHFGISANISQNYCSQADWIGPSVAKTLVQYGLTLVKFENVNFSIS